MLSSLQANPGNPALCLTVDELTEVTDGNICGPGGENGVYLPITGGEINSTRGPFGPSFSSDGYFITNGNSSYNSLQLSLRQHITDVEFLAGYTYAKSLDNGSGYGEQINLLIRASVRSRLSMFGTTSWSAMTGACPSIAFTGRAGW